MGNYIKKFTIVVLVMAVVSFVCYTPVSAGIIPLKNLDQVEQILYGQTYDSPVVQRVERLEQTLFDQVQKGPLQDRAEQINDFVLGSEENPSLILLINSLEWLLSNQITQGSILQRIGKLESILFGGVREGTMVERVQRLAKLTLTDGKLPAERVQLPSYTVIKVKLLSKINSANLMKGEKIGFEVTEDLKVDDCLVIPRGTEGQMETVEVENAGNFGKSGSVKLKLNSITLIDGTKVPVALHQQDEDNKNRQLAIGASLLGTVILSNPLGLIVGYFVKGEEKVIPAGTEFTVKTTADTQVYALQVY